MNTKVLSCLVAGLLSAVTLAAEEYRVTIPGNNVLSPIANHLNHSPDNTLSSLFPNVPIGTRVWKWVCNLGYVSSRRGASGAWIPSFTLAPGEGALIQFPGPDLTITFTGDRVPFTPPPLSCNCDAVYFLGAQTPDIGTWETIVGAKPPEGALLMRYAVPTQSWATNLFTNCKWSDGVPFANVGEAVLLYIPCGTNDCPCPDEAIGLFNTGVDTNRQVLTWGTDPHYQVSDGSNAPQQAVIITDPPYDWVTNGNNSGWIGVDTNGWGGSNVVYTYRTTFWLPCTNEVIITGRWAVADSGVMTLNSGSPPAATLSGSDAASAWHGFGINRGFVKGWNTLEFQVSSAQGRTGLRVELGGTAQCCNCKAPVCVTIEDGTFATFLGEAGCATETTTGVTLTEDSPGPSGLATDHFLRMQDQYGVSVAYSDAVAGDWLCTNNCLTLYYDFRIFDDGDPTAHLAIQPTITIVSHPDCNQPRLRAEWIPNAPVTEDTGTNGGWHTIAAPLLPACNGQPPPSPHGQWLMLDGASPSRWLELLGHVTAIELHGDYTGPNLERVGWDNFCVLTNCECRLNITCFSNRLVECQSSWDFDTPVAADGCCGIANLTYQDTSGWVAGSPCLHWFTRTWTATDGAGHQVSCSQTITEQDTTAPTINCSGLQALPITVTNACKGYVPDFCISNYFSDNCCPAFCLRQDPLANTVLGAGIHPVVLTVSDSAGNLALCTIYFTVIAPTQQRAWNSGMSGENAAPWRVIQTPAGTTDIPAILTAVPTGWLPNDAASSWVSYLDNTFTSPAGWFIYRLTFNLTCTNDAAIAGRFAVDNAAWIYLNGLYTGADAPNPGYGAWHPVSITHGFQLGANTLDICVTNGGGWTGIRAELTNTYTCCCTNAISVKCPSNLLACVCGTNTHAYVDFTVTATNHCTNTVVSVISTPPPGWFPIGNTWVTTVARDELGNEASCSFLVTVIKDTAPPSLTVPANIVRYTCDNRVQVYYKATATDNCDKEVAITYDPPSGSWFDSGTTRLVTARAVDDCGLVTTRTFTVQVISKLYWQEYPAGKDDCFQAPPEDPYRVGCFTTAFPGVTWSKFDCTQRNRHFGYSWRNLLGGNIQGEVALEMKPLGSAFALNPNSRNDAIGFDTHLCPASSFLWDNQIESLPGTGTWRPMSQPNKCGRKFTFNSRTCL
jgi:hypothetical protein